MLTIEQKGPFLATVLFFRMDGCPILRGSINDPRGKTEGLPEVFPESPRLGTINPRLGPTLLPFSEGPGHQPPQPDEKYFQHAP